MVSINSPAVEGRDPEDSGLRWGSIPATPLGCRTDCLTGECDTLSGSCILMSVFLPGVFGAAPLDSRAQKRAPLSGCLAALSDGSDGSDGSDSAGDAWYTPRKSSPSDDPVYQSRSDHHFLSCVSRDEVPKAAEYSRDALYKRRSLLCDLIPSNAPPSRSK